MDTKSADQIEASDSQHPSPAPNNHESEAFNPTKPSIDVPLHDNKGTVLKRNLVISSAVKNPSSLIAGIADLLHPPSSEAVEGTQNNENNSDTPPYWTLEPTGNAIMRVFAFGTEEQVARFRDEISTVSDEMDHHASMSMEASSEAGGSLARVRVRCTTHRPAGLSMRDVRLARKINELAATMT